MLSDLHTELIDYLTGKMPGVTVAAFTPDIRQQRTLALPACLIELATIEPFSDFGNHRDKSRVYLNFEARLLVDPIVADGWVDLKEFAAVAWWALRDFAPQTAGVGPINLKRAGEDVFKPGLDGFMVWLIEWEQEAYLDFATEQVEPVITKITATDNMGNTTEVTE
jgi:hypothetical protein